MPHDIKGNELEIHDRVADHRTLKHTGTVMDVPIGNKNEVKVHFDGTFTSNWVAGDTVVIILKHDED